MTPVPKRRWSYSLRTLFVVVTIGGTLLGWLAYHINWIRQRDQFERSQKPIVARSGTPAPLPLRFFGVPGVDWIATGPMESSELEDIKKIFPEARFTEPFPGPR